MSRLRVIVTRPDGGADVIVPSPRCLSVLVEGGGICCVGHSSTLRLFRLGLREWLKAAGELEAVTIAERTGYLPLRLARAWEIAKLVRDPKWKPDRTDREAFAALWIDRLIHGGLTEAEAVALIGEYSAAPGSLALAVTDVDNLPADRTYRNAWRRSANGGPVWICEEKRREIEERIAWRHHEAA